MDANQFFPDKFLKAADLQGRNISVVIERVEVATFNDGKQAPELFFQGKSKSLTLNKTNTKSIITGYGGETNNWIGKTIELRPGMTTNLQGQPVETIFTWIPEGPVTQAPPPIQDPPIDPVEDEIPF